MYYDTRSLDHFIRVLFIFVPYYQIIRVHFTYFPRILTLFTHFILRLYISLTRNIFPIPDYSVDRRKLGSELLILNSSFRPHSNFYIVNKLFSFFSSRCFLKAARVPTAFLFLPNFHSCFYNSIETRYMFSIS